MKNKIESGASIDLTASGAAIASGQAVLVGKLLVVAAADIADGEMGAAAACGVFELPKASSGAIAQGAQVYWNDTNKEITTTASGNTACGKAWADAADGDGLVRVGINV